MISSNIAAESSRLMVVPDLTASHRFGARGGDAAWRAWAARCFP
jgi:hypothetical protein